MDDYMAAVDKLYARAAQEPDAALCCTQVPPWRLPGLKVPGGMLERNYGCGSTVHPRDLADAGRVLYVGVGAGLEVLQLSYFVRGRGGVVGVDRLQEMLDTADTLLAEADRDNEWFQRDFVELRRGDARDLPIASDSVDLVAQNCLFNIFAQRDLSQALRETHRVLRDHGRLVLSDPIASHPIPRELADDDGLRAQCLSGALPLREYLQAIVDAGFGTIEVRARRPYRVLPRARFHLEHDILLESVEVVAIKDPIPEDGPCIFTGRCAIYVGEEPYLDDGRGHVLTRDMPMGVCDKTAAALGALNRDDLVLTQPTFHYNGDGCC